MTAPTDSNGDGDGGGGGGGRAGGRGQETLLTISYTDKLKDIKIT